MKICVFGNCQAGSIKASLEYLLADPNDITVFHVNAEYAMAATPALAENMAAADILITQETLFPALPDGSRPQALSHQRHIVIPSVVFRGFHPDMFYLPGPPGRRFVGPFSDYSSKLTLAGLVLGLSPEQTMELFKPPVYGALKWRFSGFLSAFVKQWAALGLDISSCTGSWLKHGRFMHTLNHPRLRVVSDIVALALKANGIACRPGNAADVMVDPIMPTIWPSPPALDLPDTCRADIEFLKIPVPDSSPQRFMFLAPGEYVARAHAELKSLDLETLPPSPFLDQFRRILRIVEPFADAVRNRSARAAARNAANPYRGLPAHQFWKQAVEAVAPADLNPMVNAAFRVSRTERIATAGSCFAQHIARKLAANGFNYFVTETAPPHLGAGEAQSKSYGLFSARYGNIYTVKQLRQLCERAFGLFEPIDREWPVEGGVIDPFRPRIEPEPFASGQVLADAREDHLEAVRRLFATADTFIFTMGLTEAWRAKSDGAVFPLAPAVAADIPDPSAYEFVNFDHDEIRGDLAWTIGLLRQRNPKLRVILTVSPVPLVATYEKRHVLVSTAASKAILRAAADWASKALPDVMYFPAYEIITSPLTRGAYFDSDLRTVTEAGVGHVMRAFFESCTEGQGREDEAEESGALEEEDAAAAKIVCDEEMLAASNERL